MIQGTCQVCCKVFYAKRKTQKHCSRDCFGVSHRKHIPWNKGKERPPFSYEWINNMSLAQKGKKKKPFTNEHRKNIGLARLGIGHSENTRTMMRKHSFCKGKLGKESGAWKGGKRKRKDGYIYSRNHPLGGVYGYILEHRLVMENKLGRFLKPEEVIHHINQKRDDNRIENLMLFENDSAHIAYHELIRCSHKAP